MFDKRLTALVTAAKKYIAGNVAFQWLGLLANIVMTLAIASFLQALLLGEDSVSQLPQLLAVCAACAVVRFVCTRQAQMLGARASQEAKRTIRQAIYDKLVKLGPSYTDTVATSEATQVAVEGVEQLESYFGAYIPQFFYAMLAPLTLFVCLAPLCLPAAVVLLVCVPLIPVSIVAIQKFAKRVMGAYWDSYIDLGGTFLENLQGLTTLKIYQADAAQHQAMNAHAESFRKATMNLLRMQLQSVTVMDLFAFGGAAVGIIAVLFQFADGNASFVAAFAVIFLSADFFIPMRTLGSLFHTAMNGMAAADKMFKLLAAEEPAEGTRTVAPDSADVRLSNVEFSYDGQRQVLHDVSLHVPCGSFVALVGESGSGKSTLASIVAGYSQGYTGSVTLGGVPVEEISRACLARTLTTVSFESWLFKGSVRENLLLACPNAADEQLWAALEACCLSDFVRAGGGLDMQLQEQAANLSGGQRQRLALARALLHDTPIYLFDEATSNIDAESEQAILAVIHRLAQTKTVIMISHRLAAVTSADCIYVLDHGCVVEHGTHEQLVADAEGTYAALWAQQRELEELAARGGNAQVAKAGASEGVPIAAGTPDAVPAAEPPARPRSNVRIMGRMLKLVGPLAGFMVLAIVLGVLGFTCATMLTVAGVYGVLGVLGQMGGGFGLGAAVALVVLCGVLRGPLHYGEQICNHYLAFRILALVRSHVFGALRRLAPAKLEGRDKGNLISVVTGDIELLEVFYAHTISPIAIALVMAAIFCGFMGAQHPLMGVLALAAYLVVAVVVPLCASRAQGTRGRAVREAVGAMNSFVLDSLRGLRETLQYGGSAARLDQLNTGTQNLIETEHAMKRTSATFGAVALVAVVLFDLAAVALAGTLHASGQMSFAEAALAVACFMSSFGPFIAVANLGSTLQQTLASGARVLDLLDEEPETLDVEDGADLDPAAFAGAETQNVSFAYELGQEPVLQDVSLCISPGQVVRIAGKSGQGKSTLCKLLMRFWDATSGTVLVSGSDVRRVNTASLRNIEGYMTQTTHLFSGTIGQNIRLARPFATDAEVMEACRKAAIAPLIESLPQGLDTPVGELGSTLSGGERQRIGLARVFLHDAPFVLLDEPTSNLDVLSEAAVLQALEQARAGKTIVLVSHRESTGAFADVTFNIQRGRVS